ncbi:MAG TPA: hypothetical protein VKR32_08635 [Puia sp.]|nr:hypothetical protein [Puia sp.]
MSLLNNSNNKNKKGNKSAKQAVKPGLNSAKGKMNTKGAARNAKFTGGAQRGS